MSAFGDKPLKFILRSGGWNGRKSVFDAVAGWTVHQNAFLWGVENDRVFTQFGVFGQPKTGAQADFCIEIVERLLERSSCEIFNTDQGSQFTTPRFTQPLLAQGIKVSMDGRGRALDNIFVERLWRTVKYEYVYLHELASVNEARCGLAQFFKFYNQERFRQSLNYKTPAQIYGAGS